MLFLIFVVLLFANVSHSSPPPMNRVTSAEPLKSTEPLFRPDYNYIKKFDAFYKIHMNRMNFSNAMFVCKAEGAQMWLPASHEEIVSVFETKNGTLNSIWIALHDLFFEGAFTSLDGVPAENLYVNWSDNEPNNANNDEDCVQALKSGAYNDQSCSKPFNFVCKRDAQGITYNKICKTYDEDYKYSPTLDACYKFHTKAMTWKNAFIICRSEMADMAVINSNDEAQILVEEFSKYSQEHITGVNVDKNSLHLGFSDIIRHGLFQTIFGKSLDESGYDTWSEGKHNEHCGCMKRDGKLSDIDCEINAMFVCKKPKLSMGKTVEKNLITQ